MGWDSSLPQQLCGFCNVGVDLEPHGYKNLVHCLAALATSRRSSHHKMLQDWWELSFKRKEEMLLEETVQPLESLGLQSLMSAS